MGPPDRPHILFLLQDDLGHYNVAFNSDRSDKPSADVASVSPQLTGLAKQGIILDRHYTHWHCSPTRRSLLTGRLPLHHGEKLSGIATDDIDLRWKTIGQKLEAAGYRCHWYGKGHTGYKSMSHLPVRLGFSAGHVGFLSGMMSYTGTARWREEAPFSSSEYSTDLYGQAAVRALDAHDPAAAPIFLYLPWQAVHTPYTPPPGWNASEQQCDGYADACVLYGMLQRADAFVGQLVSLLHSKGMWGSTIVVFSADNGGVSNGVNYPLRGEKHTSWDGGMRVAAFVSGGVVPGRLRGTSSSLVMHIADWYPTLCNLAGVSAADDPPVPPLPVDPSRPSADIYGNHSFPPVDGVDVWPLLTSASAVNSSAAHPVLMLSTETMIAGRYKLVVAQPDPATMSASAVKNGWKYPNGTWLDADDGLYGCNAYKNRSHFEPCVFDLDADPYEVDNLAAAQPDLVFTLWALLNRTQLTAFHARSPAALLGTCNASCARGVWGRSAVWGQPFGGGEPFGEAADKDIGPICGVPGCG